LYARPDLDRFWHYKRMIVSGYLRILRGRAASDDRWNMIRALLFHELHHFVRHQRSVFNRRDASQYRTFHSFCTMCMCCRMHAVILSSLNNCIDFFLRELWSAAIFRDAQYATGSGDLDEIRTIFVALPHGLLSILGAVDHTFLGTRITH